MEVEPVGGVSVIAKKEVSDFVSNRAFQLTLLILMVGMMIAGTAIAHTPRGNLLVIRNEAIIVTTVGALVAIACGFNSMNKERAEGSMKVLLSYPVFRDQIILGKLLGGLLVVSITTVASLGIGFVCFFVLMRLLPTFEMFLRLSVFALLTTLFLAGWMGLGILLSIIEKDSKKTLLILLLLVGLLNPEVINFFQSVVPRLIYGPYFFGSQPNTPALTLSGFIWNFSPVVSYVNLATALGIVMVNSNGVLVANSIMNVLDIYSIGFFAIIPLLTFSASYMFFTKKDVT